jgi:hypothetical protein
VGVDANHVLPTKAWPGEPDRYAGYLASLKRHFAAHRPLLVAEFGVPSSLGSAHYGTNGRDQGGHSEAEAMAIDAELMRMMADQGIAGADVLEQAFRDLAP